MNAPDTKPASPLDALASEADTLAAATTSTEAANDPHAGDVSQAAPRLTNAQLLAGAISMTRDTVTAVAGVQSIQATLGQQQVQQLATLWGDALDSYGFQLSDTMGRHAPLISAIVTTLAIGRNVLAAYRAEAAAKKAEAPEPSPAPPPPEGAAQ